MNHHELLHIATLMGQKLLENGAEIYRVEESVERIIKAYGVDEVHVYAVVNTIIVSITLPDRTCLSKTVRIHIRQTNLDRIKHLNHMSRQMVLRRPTYEDSLFELNQILARPVYSLKMEMFAYALTSSTFALFFNGTLSDALCAFMIGPLLRLASHYLGNLKTNPFFTTIACSFIAGLFSILMTHFSIGENYDKIIIGIIMNLVPGVALTNAVRDLIAGDTIAGQSKLIEAILTATCIAIGTGSAVSMIPLFM